MQQLLQALRVGAHRNLDLAHVAELLAHWSAGTRAAGQVGDYLRTLSADRRRLIGGQSRETATHYAWCLVDNPDQPFSVWVNEYKPARRWPATYANSVHNHRYDFCTRILSGGYRHQQFVVTTDAAGRPIATSLAGEREADAGEVLVVSADHYHRIPSALDGTMTLLVKARPRFPFTYSYDPTTGESHIHRPIESRVDELIGKLSGPR